MKTKVDSIFVAKDISFKKIDINKNKDIGKNNGFQEKLKSFSKDKKDKNEFENNVKKQSKDDNNNVEVDKDNADTDKNKIKDGKNKLKENKDSEENNKDENSKDIIQKDEKIVESSEVQSYLLSLLDISSESNETLCFGKNLKSNNYDEMDINLEESILSLSKDIDIVSVSKELKELSEETLEGITIKASEKTSLNEEIKIEDIPEEIQVQSKNSVDTKSKDEKGSELESKSLDSGNTDEENAEKLQFQKSDNIDFNKNVEDNTKDEGKPKQSEISDVEIEDLDITRKNSDKEGKYFVSDKKTEINLAKDLEKFPNKSEPVDMKKTIEQIAEKMKFSIDNNKNQIRINLKPETLGELRMEIEVVNSVLTAKVMVDNEKTKELIQNNLFQLKDEIKNTGLEIKSFEVFVGSGNDFSKHEREQFNFNKFNKKNKNNLKIRKALKENENLSYNDPLIDNINNLSNQYSNGSLNLLA